MTNCQVSLCADKIIGDSSLAVCQSSKKQKRNKNFHRDCLTQTNQLTRKFALQLLLRNSAMARKSRLSYRFKSLEVAFDKILQFDLECLVSSQQWKSHESFMM